MSVPSADTAVSVSSEVSEIHVKKFYETLERERNSIASFYVPSSSLPDGKHLPAIVFNGNVFADAGAFQDMYKQMGPMHYDVQSLDCQIINPTFTADGSLGPECAKGRNMTLLLLVSGSVRVGPPKESELKAFSESFVLVPNNEAQTNKRKGKPLKEWLIQSQNFRFVA